MRSRLVELGGRATSGLRLLPSYLVIGEKRCGSTSLQSYLTRHPSVLGPHCAKGTRYFDVNHGRGWDWFRGHFPLVASAGLQGRRTGVPPITGDASAYAAFHPLALERVAARLPDIRLIMLVRDPIARAHSHFRDERARGFEPVASFEEALEREDERLDGEVERMRRDPSYVSHAHMHYSYLARGVYADALGAIRRLFPTDQVLVVEHERFFADPATGLDHVFAFLGLPPLRLDSYPAHRAAPRGEAVPGPLRERLETYFAPHHDRLVAELETDPFASSTAALSLPSR